MDIVFQFVCRYVEVNMDSAAIVWPLFNSLQAFWPGLQVSDHFFFMQYLIDLVSFYVLLNQVWDELIEPYSKVLAGDIDPAIRTHSAFLSVWKRYGYTPEGFNLATLTVQVAKLFEIFMLYWFLILISVKLHITVGVLIKRNVFHINKLCCSLTGKNISNTGSNIRN